MLFFVLLLPGKLVDVKVSEKTRDGLAVAVLPHNIPAFLPTPHLSDHVAHGPLLYHWLQAGDSLHRVLCLSQSEGRVVSLLVSEEPWALAGETVTLCS